VTGGSKGLGFAIADELASLGASVLITARSEQDLSAAAAAIAEKHPAASAVQWVAADVSAAPGVEDVVARAAKLWGGRLDVLVNNVGTNKRQKIDEAADEDYHLMVRTNQDSAYLMCKRCLPLLRHADARLPSVVNVASAAGVRSTGTGVAYAMTKAAMVHMSEVLACEWACHGIRVNAVCPWMTMTPLLREAVKANPAQLDVACEATPLGRLAEPEDTAGAVAFLCMAAAAYITGQVLSVDGGLAAQGFRGPCAASGRKRPRPE